MAEYCSCYFKKEGKRLVKTKLAKLVDVKSIVTLVFTLTFTYLSVTEKVSASQFVEIYLMIIGFYFGTQAKKGDKANEN